MPAYALTIFTGAFLLVEMPPLMGKDFRFGLAFSANAP
jgi:hypothetical protein